jgi:glutathione-independent formaldehyde dehydrogenase
MKAVLYKGQRKVSVEEVPDPKIEKPTDAIIKLTTSGICGSDLHVYDVNFPAGTGLMLGHEPMGIVAKVGDAVQTVKEGDRVVIPFNVACGFCSNCIQGHTEACLSVIPGRIGVYYGVPPFGGGQAEYLRVPNADWGCLKLPGQPFDSFEDDFVLLSDIFATAYYATEMAGVKPSLTVAVFGAGPVGLLCAYNSIIKGASEVFIVDKSEARLDLAKTIGATPINFTKGDPVEQILQIRKQNQAKPSGEEAMPGVMCGIDAVGGEAVDRENIEKINPTQVLSDLARVVNTTGKIGVVGVYAGNPMGKTLQEKGWLTLPFSTLWFKGVTVGMGSTPVKTYQKLLRDLIIEGKAKPSLVVSNHYSIDEAPTAYEEFSKRDKVIKPVIQFK